VNLRQLLDTYRHRAAQQQAQDRATWPEDAGWAQRPLRSGWCVITDDTDADDGKYEITELWWDQTADGGKGAWTEAGGPPGLVEAVAYEANRADTGLADDQCVFWQTRTQAGVLQTHLLFAPADEIRWGKAKSTWTDGVVGPEVTVYPCEDAVGTNPDTSTEHVVLFDWPDRDMSQPNVRTDDIVGYVKSGSTYRCVWGARYQERIGSVKMWHDTGSIPAGWQLADGTGGTRDLRGRFLVGYDSSDSDYSTVGNTGGSKTSTPDDHAAHSHGITTATKQEGTGANFDAVGSCWTADAGPQSHSSQDNRPPYYVLVWIERVD